MVNTRYPATISDRTLTVMIDFELYHVPRPAEGEDTGQWDRVKAAIDDPNTTDEQMLALVKPAVAIQRGLTNPESVAAAAGAVTLEGGVLRYNGVEVHTVLTDRILDIVRQGFDIEPWIRFADNLFANPAPFSIDELYLFLEHGDLPITDDGCFLAYKNVRANFTDIHSGQFDNSVGQICEMERSEVDPNRNRTCSSGLHFCSKAYLPSFSHGGSGGHTMIVKINPADVVSIPSDYKNTKGRAWRYEVVGEIPETKAKTYEWPAVVEEDFTADVEDERWDYEEPEPETPAPAVEYNPSGSRFKRWLRRNNWRS